ISAIANKSTREVKYHLRFSSEWVKRLGDGTEESHRRMQAAIDYLWPYAGELFKETELEAEMKENEIGADLAVVKQSWSETIAITLHDATIQMPENAFIQSGGKKGIHSEHLGFILADLQFMQRTYPNMTW
ncbi:MAG: phenylacetate-CoA oxygenase subunit PaaC, partial [Bacteroidetes bacterium]|nr:phenylacetate-CoA oxygenase subunit PaaC [Bacteroidota bacterium]